MKKKLAFIDLTNFKDWPMGGMLQYERQILPELCKKFDVDIWGVSVDGKNPENLIVNGIEYPIHVWANAKTKKRIIPNYLKGLELYKFKNKFKNYDIIYAHTATCIIPFFSFKKNIKLVYHQHGLMYLEDKSLKTKIQKPFMKLAQENSNLVFVVSGQHSVDNYRKKINATGKLVDIKSPIVIKDLNEQSVKEKLKKDNPTKFIYTGRLTKFKNVAALIPIFSRYVDEVDSSAILTIVGDGEEKKHILNLIKEYHMGKSIFLTGKLPHYQIKRKLFENDIFLMPSNGEGVSVSVAEANSFGLPVVSFNVSGLNEQVISGVNGYKGETSLHSFYRGILNTKYNWKKLVESSFEYSKQFEVIEIENRIIGELDRI